MAEQKVPTFQYVFEYRGQYSIVNLQGEQVLKRFKFKLVCKKNVCLLIPFTYGLSLKPFRNRRKMFNRGIINLNGLLDN